MAILAGPPMTAAFLAARAAATSAAASSSRLYRMFTAPSAPMTAISAVGHAKFASVRMCLLDITQ